MIDRQHKRIVSLINDLHSLVVDGKDPSATYRVFSELAVTAAHHFVTEEVLMEFTRYPGLLAHQAEHRQLLDRVGLLKQDCDAGRGAVSIQVTDFLRTWIVEHTAKSDQKYKPFLQRFL